jgi:hypothetical protein
VCNFTRVSCSALLPDIILGRVDMIFLGSPCAAQSVGADATCCPTALYVSWDNHIPWILLLKAEFQKTRSEQQGATQAGGKRSQIDFTSASKTSSSAHRVSESVVSHRSTKLHDDGRKNKYNPYISGGGLYDPLRGNAHKGREKSRWG